MPLTGVDRLSGYLSKKGSAYIAASAVDTDGTDKTSPDTVHNMGYIKKYTYSRKKVFAEELDQGGTNRSSDFTVEAEANMKFMQRDVPHITLTDLITEGEAVRFYWELSAVKLGSGGDKGQIMVWTGVPAEKGLAFDGEDMHPDTKWTPTPNSSGSDIVIDLTDFTGGLGAGVGNATIAAGDYEDIVEFTYA